MYHWISSRSQIIVDQLALVRALLDDDDITFHSFNCIGSEYKEIA